MIRKQGERFNPILRLFHVEQVILFGVQWVQAAWKESVRAKVKENTRARLLRLLRG